ncbi:hypothetical protein LEP1GSC133_2504 [Leptospira borgpetersenii serovar Pomona str. 200901868]|uniref:Uncharacterized protein n=1 Tax=Leptospira borgpetersenii serovar Pomona str. 200901868 TaxID=1192866 RepID=M6WJM3_LEPBO|nr:hypothetical protein LEP1GSC133_2504 [Leptospira borgpetersenii serovar Pomona str. 200901868]
MNIRYFFRFAKIFLYRIHIEYEAKISKSFETGINNFFVFIKTSAPFCLKFS